MKSGLDNVVELADWTVTDCRTALIKQKRLISEDFWGLVKADHLREQYLRFRFRIRNEDCDEPGFYDRLAYSGFFVRDELRELVVAYLWKISPAGYPRLWYDSDEGIPAMTSAVSALAVVDADASEIILPFMAMRDQEHEQVCWNKIALPFAEIHGWKTRSALENGLLISFVDENAGWERWYQFARTMIRDGRHFLSSEDFAALLVSKSEYIDRMHGSNEVNRGGQLAEFLKSLNSSDAYEVAVRSAVLQAFPSVKDKLSG